MTIWKYGRWKYGYAYLIISFLGSMAVDVDYIIIIIIHLFAINKQTEFNTE